MIVTLGWSYNGKVTSPPFSVVVDATKATPYQMDETIIHQLGNKRGLDVPVGWIDRIELVVEEDQLMLQVTVSGTKVLVAELVRAFRRAPFRYIKHDMVNSGEWLRVTHGEVPVEEAIDNSDDMKKVTMLLVGDVFHKARRE